jgi:hypothetical protein
VIGRGKNAKITEVPKGEKPKIFAFITCFPQCEAITEHPCRFLAMHVIVFKG